MSWTGSEVASFSYCRPAYILPRHAEGHRTAACACKCSDSSRRFSAQRHQPPRPVFAAWHDTLSHITHQNHPRAKSDRASACTHSISPAIATTDNSKPAACTCKDIGKWFTAQVVDARAVKHLLRALQFPVQQPCASAMV